MPIRIRTGAGAAGDEQAQEQAPRSRARRCRPSPRCGTWRTGPRGAWRPRARRRSARRGWRAPPGAGWPARSRRRRRGCATITVRGLTTSPLLGSVSPAALNSANSSLARPSPTSRPTTEATAPTTNDSIRIARRTCRRDAPSVRRVAELAGALGDRDRQRVGDHEAADEQRHAGEHEQERLEERQEARDRGGVLLGLLGAGAHLRGRRQDRPDLR